MILVYNTNYIPLKINISGKINEIDYNWRICPLIKNIKLMNFNKIFYYLFKLMRWGKKNGNQIEVKSTLLFRIAFFIFKKFEQNSI